jgi:hypothetical protein
MTIQERIEKDVARGDYGLARDRLLSHLHSKGYDPELLSQLGELCFKMHDLAAAGKYWLTSSAQGEKVDKAIEAFVSRCGEIPEHTAAQLPRFIRLKSSGGYPAPVRERLERIGLHEAIQRRVQLDKTRPRIMMKSTEWIILIIAMIIVGCAAVSCIIGAGQIGQWITK